MSRDYTYTPYNAAVTSSFAQNINHLPALREEIYTAFSTSIWAFEEAFIGSVDIRSESAFSVQLNRETIVSGSQFATMEWDYGSVEEPVTLGGEYIVRYNGPIDRLVFLGDAAVTLTFLQVGWGACKLEHKVVEFSAPEGTTLVLKDNLGAVIQPCDTLKYELFIDQVCTYTATNENYGTLENVPVTYHWEDTITVPFVLNTYTITFATTPTAGVTIVVKDEDEAVVAPTANPKVYVLRDSSVAGTYTYTVNATGYDEATGTLDVQENATETVAMDVSTWEAVFTVTPNDATFVLKDAEDVTVTPDSTTPAGTYTFNALEDSRIVGDYSFTASKTNYVTQTDAYAANADGGDTIALVLELSSIAVTTPPTKTEYVAGELFAPAGMVVTATYADATTAAVTSYTYAPDTALAVEDTEITITYVEGAITKTATQAITVTAE